MRIGLLSTARINLPAIIEPARLLNIPIVAIASRCLLRAQDYAKTYKIFHAYGDYHALLSSPHIDTVYISLPNAQHYEWTKKALLANKHVICEKPLTFSLEEAKELCDLAMQKNKLLCEGLHYQYHPFVQEVISTPWEKLKKAHVFLGIPRPSHDDIRYQKHLYGGAYAHLAIYPIHFFLSLLMRAGVQGHATFSQLNFDIKKGIDEKCTGQILGPQGVKLEFTCSMQENFLSSFVEIETYKVCSLFNNLLNPHPKLLTPTTYFYQLKYFSYLLQQKQHTPQVHLPSLRLLDAGISHLYQKTA